MEPHRIMALGGSQKENLSKNMPTDSCSDVESNVTFTEDNARKCQSLSFTFLKQQDELVNSSTKNTDSFCCKYGDRKLNEFVDCNVSERNFDDINHSSDSLSSSASISDSDLTSTDSDDSLALSESESITDVTPLNSPYCDSPLPPSRHVDYKSEDKGLTNQCRNVDYDVPKDNCHRPEMNVLMKAIEKLELEAKNNPEFGFRERRRAASFSIEESKRIEQENQRLYKRVISQQNRIRSVYSASNQPTNKSRNQESAMSDDDISGPPKKFVGGKFSKQGDKSQAHRKQKCLSHPSSFIYSCNPLIDKNLLTDGLTHDDSGKKKYGNEKGMKNACSQNVENSSEDEFGNSNEMK